MSVSLISAAFKTDLPPGPRFVLVTLANSANDDDGGCWFLLSTLSRRTGFSVRALQEHFRVLESAGYLRREFRPGRSTLFFLSLVRLGVSAVEPKPLSETGFGAPLEEVIHTPAESAPPQNLRVPPQNLRGTPAESAPPPAESAPISVSYPSSYPLNNPKRPDALKTLAGTPRPSAGGFGEGAAYAAPPGSRSPERGRGGSTAKPSVLHVSSDPVSDSSRVTCSLEEHKARISSLRAMLKGFGS